MAEALHREWMATAVPRIGKASRAISIIAILVFAGLVSSFHGSQDAAGQFSWSIETVGWGGGISGMMVDKGGTIHALFSEPWPSFALRYGEKTGLTWSFETIDSDSGQPSLALDSLDSPAVSYFRYQDRTVWYAHRVAGVFMKELVEAINGSWVPGTSLGFDREDNPHLAFRNNPQGGTGISYIRHAWRETTGWLVETVDSTVAFVNPYDWPSLDVDSQGRPHIAVYTNGLYRLDYYVRNATGWSRETVEAWFYAACCEAPSLQLDSRDRPHISSYNATGMSLRYDRYDDMLGRWILENVYTELNPKTNPGQTSLALDRSDWPRISFFDTDLTMNTYLSFEPGTGWSREIVDSTLWTGNGNSLSLDPLSAPHILYNWFDGNTTWIKHAWQEWPDTVPPFTSVNRMLPYWRNSAPVQVRATVWDPGSGVAEVTLWSRDSVDNVSWGAWTPVSTLAAAPWTWTFLASGGEGFYEFYTTSVDVVGNKEPAPTRADAIFGYDATPPFAPVVAFGALGGPSFADVMVALNAATDEGLRSGTIKYRMYRQTGVGGVPVQVAEILGTGAATYSWTDVAAGDGDPNTYIYEVHSVDSANNEATAIARAAKFTRSVSAGWNLFSVPVITANPSITSVLQTLTYNRARSFLASDTADPWKAYIPTKSYNDLTTIDLTQALWVNVLGADSFTVAGLVPSGVTITLQPGWNFVGFPSFRATTYTLADWKTAVPQITMVDTWDVGGPYYLRRMADTDPLQMGHGYWAFVNGASPVTWAVP